LARRYALLLALAALPMLLLLLGLAWQQLGAQRRAELDILAQAARERRLALDAAVAPVRDHVQALRRMAEDRCPAGAARPLALARAAAGPDPAGAEGRREASPSTTWPARRPRPGSATSSARQPARSAGRGRRPRST
jgi:hypothetical protein